MGTILNYELPMYIFVFILGAFYSMADNHLGLLFFNKKETKEEVDKELLNQIETLKAEKVLLENEVKNANNETSKMKVHLKFMTNNVFSLSKSLDETRKANAILSKKLNETHQDFEKTLRNITSK